MQASIWRTVLLPPTPLCCWAASARAARWEYHIHTHTHNMIGDYFSSSKGIHAIAHPPFCPSQINVTTVREHLPKGDFSIMTEMLKKFLSFMNLTVSMTVKTDLLSSVLHNTAVIFMIKEYICIWIKLWYYTIVTNQIDFLPKKLTVIFKR